MPHKDPLEAKTYRARRYREQRDSVIEKTKAYAEANRERIKEWRRAYYLRNRDKWLAKQKADRAANKALYRERDRLNRAKNLEREREIERRRYERHKAKIKARANAYRLRNPDKRADAQQRRRALKAGAISERVLRAEILKRDGPNCALCAIETRQPVHMKSAPDDRHYDHVVPLSRGGAHSADNMRILCATCNTRKRSSLDSELPWLSGKVVADTVIIG